MERAKRGGVTTVARRFDLTKKGYDYIAQTNPRFIQSLNREKEDCADAILYLGWCTVVRQVLFK